MRIWGKRWVVSGLCLACLGVGLVVLGSASGAPATWPYVAGTWKTESTDCPGTCGTNWTFSPVKRGEAPPYAYNIFMGGVGKGFYANNVIIAGDGTATFKETCEGCTGYSLIVVTFSTEGKKNKFAGTWQPFSPHSNAPGAPVEPGETTGKISGELIARAPDPYAPAGTSDWPPAKCKRILQAWTKTHKAATTGEKRAEEHALKAKHDCKFSLQGAAPRNADRSRRTSTPPSRAARAGALMAPPWSYALASRPVSHRFRTA